MAVADSKRNLEEAVSRLIEVAQRAGAVRDDVSSAVVLSLVGATCIAADHPHGSAMPQAMMLQADPTLVMFPMNVAPKSMSQ